MNITDMINTAKDSVSVKRVFGEAYEKDGLTIIPAAVVSGGGGGGTGHDENGQQGEGAGFGVMGRPAGAYVIRGGEVRWQPAIDVNRVITVCGVIITAWLITRPRMKRARARAIKTKAEAAKKLRR